VGIHADDRVNTICESFCQDRWHKISSGWDDVRTASAREAVTRRHICDESRDNADRLLIRPARRAGPAPATCEDKSDERHTARWPDLG
jgi:hypothetical protein